jgi:hypothetical protein
MSSGSWANAGATEAITNATTTALNFMRPPLFAVFWPLNDLI